MSNASMYPIEFQPARNWPDTEFKKPRYQKGFFIFTGNYADVKIYGWAETKEEAQVIRELVKDRVRKGHIIIDTVFNFYESF